MLEPRGAVLADVEIAGLPLRIVATHLSLFRAYRRMQIASITSQLNAAEDGIATVILGDFNEWWNSVADLKAFHRNYRVVAAEKSFPSALPAVGLERIITCTGLSVFGAGAHQSNTAKIASDHLPVWAELGFGDQAGRMGAGTVSADKFLESAAA